MLVTANIRFSRILRNTWHVDLIMIGSCTGAYLIHKYLLNYHIQIPVIVPTVLGTAIAFFIGFNNNQSYDRWWEARKVWGALVNDSRSWARSVLSYIDKEEVAPEVLKGLRTRLIYRHIGFLYTLKGALRGGVTDSDKTYIPTGDLHEVDEHTNLPNALLLLQARELQALHQQGYIDGFRLIQLDALLVKFTDEMGMSERIKNTVFPTTYSYFTKLFIWLFVVSIALVTSQTMGIWSIPMSWLLGFVFVSTQINGMSLINPFENNVAAIPLNQITRTIEINLLQMLGEKNVPEPVKPINGEYVL